MDIAEYFTVPQNSYHKQYLAMRDFLHNNMSAEETAKKYGYTKATIYSLARDFKKMHQEDKLDLYLFAAPQFGRPQQPDTNKTKNEIIALRKHYLSVDDIKEKLDATGKQVSEAFIYKAIKAAGFAKLPKRTKTAKLETMATSIIAAPVAKKLTSTAEIFSSSNAGILCFLPIIIHNKIDELIKNSAYPETKTISKVNAILSFVALKLSSIQRYSKDDLWCMDRGLGLFAGLNVLPKASWFSSYSHGVTREMNLAFLQAMNQLWQSSGLLNDTANMDFTTIPYWGDDAHLENNWSGTRHTALTSILAALAHDPDTGIITYGDADIQHRNEKDVAVEFLDFYKKTNPKLKYLVFDSKFTTYQNLKRLDTDGVKFITIRRRGEAIVAELNQLPKTAWKQIRVMAGTGKNRLISIHDSKIFLRGYEQEVRQIAILGKNRIQPALIITNDFELSQAEIVRKYAKRWLVEKTISEEVHFFHFNRVSSSMVIKVDFDLTMTILAYNLYRLIAKELPRYERTTAVKLYEKFISNGGKVTINDEEITIALKKKRHLPAILSTMQNLAPCKASWLKKNIKIIAASHT